MSISIRETQNDSVDCTEAGRERREGKLSIVVLGTGFAGSSFITAFNRRIKKDSKKAIELIAINSRNYMMFSPLLYEVATGKVYGYHVSSPICCTIEDFGYRFIEADTTEIIPERNEVVTTKGTVHYDRLIIALGSESNDFGIPGVKEHSLPLKSIKDGEKARNRVLESYKEAVSRINSGSSVGSLLTFVIIGGGATGVELSTSLLEFVDDLNRNHRVRSLIPRIVLIEANDKLMSGIGGEFSEKLANILKRKGVELLLGKKVIEVAESEVILSDGNHIQTRNVFWTAGIKTSSVVSSLKRKLNERNGDRLAVDNRLRVASLAEVYAIGDSALPFLGEGESPPPQTAAAAVQEGKYLGVRLAEEFNGKNLGTRFRYHDHGTFLSAGRFTGICKFSNGVILTGFTAWFLWRFIHLWRISTIRNKFEVLTDWTFSLFHKGIFVDST
ncbi:MAG: NAD(P)/FAD-dependent oxidoreductase [Thermoplasmatales archaeon]|jgi:NADH dehydrogenase|nr:NAD(P)/FAD-dependent oxidoreductase [Thermoplasmatales archaeon]